MTTQDFKDVYYRDLGFDYFKPENDSIDNIILNDNKGDTRQTTTDTDVLNNYSENISIRITKDNTSFDFASKFRDFLLNDTFRSKDNLINFFDESCTELGQVLYERIQNFLNNYINIDCCSYKALLNFYVEDDVDIKKIYTANYPEKLEYLINIFSVSKLYLKNNFYNLIINDTSISKYIRKITDINTLQTAEKLLNQKYFGNFYQSVVYPIVKNELLTHYDDEDIQQYILDTTATIYDSLITGDYAKYAYLLFLKSSFSSHALEEMSALAVEKYNTESNKSEGEEIPADYFQQLITHIPDRDANDENGETYNPTVSISNLVGSGDGNLLTTYNYEQMFEILEKYFYTRSDIIKLLRIKLCAQKITNICNTFCQLREDIKQIRVKDSKIGTSILLEQLVTEFLLKKFVKKVGTENQGKIANNLSDIDFDSITHTQSLDILKDIFEKEQGTIGIQFEDHFQKLSALVSTIDAEIVEYNDITQTYLNLIPNDGVIEVSETYNEMEITYPPYLNVNGDAVYADYDNPSKVLFEEAQTDKWNTTKDTDAPYIYQRSLGDESTGYKYRVGIGSTTDLTIDENSGLLGSFTNGIVNQAYLAPLNSNKVIDMTNLHGCEYSTTLQLYTKTVDGKPKAVDGFGRLISISQTTELLNNNKDVIIKWIDNEITVNPSAYLLREIAGGFQAFNIFDSDGNTVLLDVIEVETIDINGTDTEIASFGLDGNWLIKVFKDSNPLEIYEIKDNVYLQYSTTGQIIDKNINYYNLNSRQTFILDQTQEELVYNTNKQLISQKENFVLNIYKTDVEKFYAVANRKQSVKEKKITYNKTLNGNTPFWTELYTNELFENKTVEEERDIVKFYKHIGLINDDLDDFNYKTTKADGDETLTIEWMLAREKIIHKLKAIWEVNAQHRWYDKYSDQQRLLDGLITENQVKDLQYMDETYHSNLGNTYNYNPKIPLKASLVNLENWENNTVAVHPFIWNLVERAYDSYLKLITISLYGKDILDKIYQTVGIFGEQNYQADDKDGSFAFSRDNSQAHNVDYWKYYNKSFFPYSTDYEISNNETINSSVMSRYVDFDGPYNYEALMDIIDKRWTEPNSSEQNSIRNLNLGKYYIEIAEQ